MRFHMLHGLADPNEVLTFGFFDGTLEELEAGQSDSDFEERRDAVAPYVEAVIANGVSYEIVEALETANAGQAAGGAGRCKT